MKSRVTMPVLHKWLMGNFPSLQYKPEDRVPRLCPSTRKGRKRCADVWRGDVLWFTRKRERVLRPLPGEGGGEAGGQEEGQEEKLGRDCPGQEVFWYPAWCGPFTFMLDATSFRNGEGPMHAPAPLVYSDRNNVYPPTPVTPDKSISQSSTTMVYVVIHKHLGVVVGPDIMLTGSKLKQSKSKLSKEEQFEQAGGKTWYGSLLALWWNCAPAVVSRDGHTAALAHSRWQDAGGKK